MELRFDIAAGLLLIAAVVAMLTRRLRLPYSAGLVAAGLGLGLALRPFAPAITLTKDLIFTALLPPLIFEAAFSLPWKKLREDLRVILVLASAGVLLSAAVTTLGMHYLARWEWLSAALFGVLIAATDPVSVIATFREAGARGRLLLLVEAESLFNDGTAAVAFGVVVAWAAGRGLPALQVAPIAILMIGGGVMCGALVAGSVLVLAGHTQDHLVEITFTTVAAYGSFLLAEHFNFSGVLATLTAGLMLGSGSSGVISERGRDAVEAFWEYAAFVANSLVFLLIGIHGARQNLLVVWLAAIAAILLVTLGRAVAIYPCCLLFSRSARRVPMAHQHVLFWGGLRGALALALALGLPPQVAGREQIITVSFAVVAFSIFVQGLSMKPLLRRLGEVGETG
ncbi:MAG: sodium:proton antiporter [Acidobacteriia bacterium]|nr:sodium:proton antiporter [Terriglobia bacterium]